METRKNIAWQAFEYQHRERGGDWFWVTGIVAVSLAITAILFKNFLFGVLIIIAAFALMLQAARKPRLVQFILNQTGIAAGNVAHPFSLLESFWIDDANPNDTRLLLKSSRRC